MVGAPKWICVSKQYLEFFCHKDVVSKLLDHVEEFNVKGAESSSAFISYYAVDKDGNLSTNCKDDDINAVTWGYFREEILQPTIVEKTSFLAWKDEVYRLFTEWAKIASSNLVEANQTQVDEFVQLMKNSEMNLCCAIW